MPLPRPAAALLAATLALPTAARADEPLQVLATVGMIADVARTVAGDCARVTALMGPGTDPHDYTATPRDVQALAGADLILYVDRVLEERLAEVLDRMADRRPVIGVLRAALPEDALLLDPDGGGEIDPHAWMDVSRWALIAPVIAEAVIDLRPDCAQTVTAGLTRTTAELAALHDWVTQAMATIPEDRRLLITAHDAFNYLADAYGLTASEAIEGISTAAEASIADILAVAAVVVENRVPAVFPETTINPRTIQALVAEVRARGHEVQIADPLFSDAMGDAGTAAGTYVGMIHANTTAIVTALGGTLPPLPEALADWAAEWGVNP